MVRAIIEFDDAEYERVRKAAADRGMTVEQFVASEAIRAVPAETTKPFESLQEWFDWADNQKFSLNGWKWNREELYDRQVLR